MTPSYVGSPDLESIVQSCSFLALSLPNYWWWLYMMRVRYGWMGGTCDLCPVPNSQWDYLNWNMNHINQSLMNLLLHVLTLELYPSVIHVQAYLGLLHNKRNIVLKVYSLYRYSCVWDTMERKYNVILLKVFTIHDIVGVFHPGMLTLLLSNLWTQHPLQMPSFMHMY